MAELIRFPDKGRRADDTDAVPGLDAGEAADRDDAVCLPVPAGEHTPDRDHYQDRDRDAGDLDDGDRDGEVVLVDPPGEVESRTLYGTVLASRSAQRRPIVPAWMRDRDELRAVSRWAAGHVAHTAAYHAVRAPKYGARLVARAPRGAARVATGTARWVFDFESRPLRLEAVRRNDADLYLRLLERRNERVRLRLIVAAVGGVVGLAGLLVLLGFAPPLAKWVALAVVVALLGWAGSPADKPLLDTAVVTPTRVQRLTSDIVIRALGSLGIAEINKVLAKNPKGIAFVAPITRDGPGWRADIDLPYGVTVTDIIERRDRLASGLRRPLGCVWPEPAHDAHAGRLVLWVGDQDMSQVKPPAWPLAKGQADLFKPLPFGTDQRGRPVTLTLMFANMLIAAMPGMGKTFALRILALAAALDPLAELRVFELKGTGDLSAMEKVAHHYASGPDDETIAACLASLREVHKDLERRAKTIASLPKDVCPENKVTPQLAAKKSLGLRPLVVIIDECQELFTHPDYGKEAAELSTAIIKRGRALGVILLLATQRPDKDSLPTGVSANVGIRFCLRVMGQVENDMVLGTSAYRNGIRATTFTKKDKGIGYLVGDADDPQVVRSYYVDNPTADRITDRARALRQAAGTLTGYAIGEQPDLAETKVSLLEDVAAVITPGEDKIWSETVVARLAELRPDLYGGWTPAQLADALKPYGITTEQVWGRTDDGKPANRRGIVREHILTALQQQRRSARG